jgi:hypothetical protein
MIFTQNDPYEYQDLKALTSDFLALYSVPLSAYLQCSLSSFCHNLSTHWYATPLLEYELREVGVLGLATQGDLVYIANRRTDA